MKSDERTHFMSDCLSNQSK
ncbi:MAG: hypothetical protein BVN28_09685 [Nitrospira sp. ST-bin4]|nr:MAG: hypothetical protein BVN28_09685 [Nitrospira sp. ST-bin4]